MAMIRVNLGQKAFQYVTRPQQFLSHFQARSPSHLNPQLQQVSYNYSSQSFHPPTIHKTLNMEKIKQIFHKDKDGSSDTSSSAAPKSSGNPDGAKGVILHTTLGDITIDLYEKETPRVRLSNP